MTPSDEHRPLLACINEDAIEQGLRAPVSHKQPPLVAMRRAVAGVVFAVFLCTVLSYTWLSPPNIHEFRMNEEFRSLNEPEFPDFSRYGERVQMLSLSQLHFEEGGRLIIVGDIHGMKQPLDHLLKKLRFQPHKDRLVHTGDALVKGPQSLETLEFLTANNVSGVRGNHDQRVIEWRSWFNWVRSLPDGENWLERYQDRNTYSPISIGLSSQSYTHGATTPEEEEDMPNTFPFPSDWIWGSAHWLIARDMTNAQYEYLLSLPLILHIPSLHIMVVHAGLLPFDPRKPLTSKQQPLARVPVLPSGSGSLEDRLRNAQELAVIEEIPQNNNPWVITNLRSLLKNGRVSKGNKKGEPWPKVWNQIMKQCGGFDVGSSQSRGKGFTALPCLPFTIVYGHAAARGKDVRTWSKGVDSGCVKGRKLSALVYSEGSASADFEDQMDNSIEVEATELGHNSGRAQIVSIKCDKRTNLASDNIQY